MFLSVYIISRNQMQRSELISVEITKFGEESVTVRVPDESTLRFVLEEANMTVGSSEAVHMNGETDPIKLDDKLEDGDTLQIVGRKEGGLL